MNRSPRFTSHLINDEPSCNASDPCTWKDEKCGYKSHTQPLCDLLNIPDKDSCNTMLEFVPLAELYKLGHTKYGENIAENEILYRLMDTTEKDIYDLLDLVSYDDNEEFLDTVLYYLTDGNEDYLDNVMNTAIKNGKLNLINQLNFDPNIVIMEAAHYGNVNIVTEMLNDGADNYNGAMANAAFGGFMDIVVHMIYLGATDFNWGLEMAAYGGHLDIVKLMLYKGANNFQDAIEAAAEHQDIVDFLTHLDLE